LKPEKSRWAGGLGDAGARRKIFWSPQKEEMHSSIVNKQFVEEQKGTGAEIGGWRHTSSSGTSVKYTKRTTLTARHLERDREKKRQEE